MAQGDDSAATRDQDRRAQLEQACIDHPESLERVLALAQLLEQSEDFTALNQLLSGAVERWPNDIELRLERARIALYQGEKSSAIEEYLAVLALDPEHLPTFCSLVFLNQGSRIGGLERLENLSKGIKPGTAQAASLDYARGLLLEREGHYRRAFDAYREANRVDARFGGMDLSAKVRGARIVIEDIQPAVVERYRGLGNQSEQPVFIIGMPRSGTSLTEQIIGAHPQVYSAGESLAWGNLLGQLVQKARPDNCSMIEAIHNMEPEVWVRAGERYLADFQSSAREAARITNKLPANYGLLPFVKLVFPQARIIHLRRHPLAVLCSCIRQDFKEPSLAFSVDNWARFYGVYQALMETWEPILGDQMLTLDYETLVTDFPNSTRRLIGFLGLEWDDACLRPEANRRAVRTASVQQVREPVNTAAVAAWEHFRDELEPLLAIIEETRHSILSGLDGSP